MIRKQEGTFLSEADGLEISALCIIPEEKTEYRAVVQLVHGMSEHKERYIPFMEYLAEKGYIRDTQAFSGPPCDFVWAQHGISGGSCFCSGA